MLFMEVMLLEDYVVPVTTTVVNPHTMLQKFTIINIDVSVDILGAGHRTRDLVRALLLMRVVQC